MVHQDGPISKRLPSSQDPAEQIKLIKEMLADKSEQRAAESLEPDSALRLVEFLDLVCRVPLRVTNILRKNRF